MALILRAFDEMDREMADFKADWRERRTKLESHLARIKYEILTGQSTLFAGENGNGKTAGLGGEETATGHQ